MIEIKELLKCLYALFSSGCYKNEHPACALFTNQEIIIDAKRQNNYRN